MKTFFISLRLMIIMTIITGVVYPVLINCIAATWFATKANGSMIYNKSNKIIGSELIAQGFTDNKYFWPRPSAVNYNPMASGASNFAPTSRELLAVVNNRKKQGLINELLFSSASGLDPHISPETAQVQINRVAAARQVLPEKIKIIVHEFVEARQFGVLGEERVNVLKLNLALDERLNQ